MEEYTQRNEPVTTSQSQKYESDSISTTTDEKNYCDFAATLMPLVNSVLPRDALITSKMKQKLGNPKVQGVIVSIRTTIEILCLNPTIKYVNPDPYVKPNWSVCRTRHTEV